MLLLRYLKTIILYLSATPSLPPPSLLLPKTKHPHLSCTRYKALAMQRRCLGLCYNVAFGLASGLEARKVKPLEDTFPLSNAYYAPIESGTPQLRQGLLRDHTVLPHLPTHTLWPSLTKTHPAWAVHQELVQVLGR